MAQLTGTAGRSPSPTPAFVAGSLFAVAAMATVVILALALGVNVGLRGATTAQVAAAAAAGSYDNRLDPIEDAYIKGAHAGARSAAQPGVSTYDGQLDPIEQTYIDRAHVGKGAGTLSTSTSPAIDSSWSQSGLPRHHLVPR